MRARRSLLFVCGAEPAALEAARGSAADSLILDLEDTVTPERKPRARELVTAALRQPARAGLERAVRVNPPATPWFADDVADVVAAGADALVIGHVDLSRTLGIREAGATEGTILHARCHLVLAAKAAGRQAVDAVFMDLDDPDGLTAEARQGLRLGFTGKLVIDERQVALVHAAFRPSEAEVAYARRLVAAWDAAVAAGTGVFVFEGRVIDRPVVEAERTVLARAALP